MTLAPPNIILASGSAIRRQLLASAGVVFSVVPADVDEGAIRADLTRDSDCVDPDHVAGILARAKAEAVSAAHPHALVIGADQILSLGSRLFEKPGDLSAAPPDCNSVFPFEKAEAFVTRLAALVRPGGFLALWHVHFRLSDMAISSAFEPVFDLADDVDANQPLYGPGGARILDKVCTTAIYRKRR